MRARVVMWVGLLVVAGAAAVLSFDSLRSLALVCGFARPLAWLLPVTIDAGAAVASLVWLGRWAPGSARRFARWLALALLGGSVVGNALGHGLAAYSARPHWLVVVAVSAVAPAVLGAVVHLAVLATHDRANESPGDLDTEDAEHPAPVAAVNDRTHDRADDRAGELIAAGAGRRRLSRELSISEHEARALLTRSRNGAGGRDE